MDSELVFAEIAASAARLCDASDAAIHRVDGEVLRLVVSHGSIPKGDDTLPLAREVVTGRAVLDGRTIQVADVQAETGEYSVGSANARRLGHRTLLAIPLMRAGEAIGVIGIRRAEVRPFTDRQIDLLKTFADQAVIAIENTRLFEAEEASKRELQEALEYQTATSEVLQVVSSSVGVLAPVYEKILSNAVTRCDTKFGNLFLFHDGVAEVVATLGVPPEMLTYLRSGIRPGSATGLGRMMSSKQTVQIRDLRESRGYLEHDPLAVAAVELAATKTVLLVPMLRDNELIGAFVLYRQEVRPFTDRQVELVSNFAKQVVIAVENTRLFEAEQASKRELTEALEQQTATADVLKVISRSALDVQKVLDALVESAARLCDAYDAIILQLFGDSLRLVAHHGQIPIAGPVGQLTIPLERGSIGARAVIDRRTIQVADMLAEADEYPQSRQRALQLSYRAALAVPLVHAGEAIGVILIRRAEVRPFTERQIGLVNTFADQAVIAIENTRLFEEVQARTRELAKTVDDLEIASQHKNQFVANMSHELRTPLAAILGYAELIQEGFYEPQGPKSLDALTRIRSNGKHLLGLINTVLDIAKIESGQFTLNMTEYAIESVVETVRAATESLAQNKKLTLTTSVDKSLPVGLGDEQRLTQVLLNLVGNAIKFTDTGEVRVTAKAANGQFNVSVTDTGPGIPEEHQARIFEQFHQVDSSNTRAKGGTGLGLAIAKQIVEMHGGRIWVESALGKGSTFQMEIPMSAPSR
jgi:signal transduction histidine kinase